MDTNRQTLASRLEIRLTADEKAAYEQSAASNGLKLAAWIRNTLNAAAGMAQITQVPPQHPAVTPLAPQYDPIIERSSIINQLSQRLSPTALPLLQSLTTEKLKRLSEMDQLGLAKTVRSLRLNSQQ